jgi:hypothetical protein
MALTFVLIRPRSTQTEERKNEHDHHDQADQIDEAIHGRLRDKANIGKRNSKNPTGLNVTGSRRGKKLRLSIPI